MIEAVLFDFDGIIVDSERLHWSAFNKVFEPLGKTISWADYIRTYIGFDDRDTFRTAVPNLGKAELSALIERKAAAFQELLESDGAAALPGAVELINCLSGNIPLAICSGALREDILPILGKLGVSDAFNTIVTANDTHISKPDPAPYRLAMQKLGVTGGLAIEDTPAGIASAKGAGLNVLSVTNSYTAEFLTQADAVVDSLEGLTLEKLNQLFSP
ncbi:MAG: HAD family phosphatase [Pontiellaceae bacterium]|jgi:beta-phosphoglucomutase|nr:HAD family phosphatase [Pontiellaceae bacterium]